MIPGWGIKILHATELGQKKTQARKTLFPLSFTVALSRKDNGITHISQAIASGVKLWNLEQFFISG